MYEIAHFMWYLAGMDFSPVIALTIMCEYSSEVSWCGAGIAALPCGATGVGRLNSVTVTGAVKLALGARKKDIYS